MSPPSNEAYRG